MNNKKKPRQKPLERDEMLKRVLFLDGRILLYVTDKKSDLTKQVALSCGFLIYAQGFNHVLTRRSNRRDNAGDNSKDKTQSDEHNRVPRVKHKEPAYA